ncbi:DnaJ C-terminal domain-containing protein [Aureimonas leprariae]|uniref:J domain-containing protein n=1 Tax=Plantimonas leprariae TaxID=2615207 RepID=A0A7V7TW98_9HYPH|nr:DnaJ C-terminal domain-containing protein [Aureimonas leprariae]KAB0679590.1 J domain-containing protein [Aureimonas leprariae]
MRDPYAVLGVPKTASEKEIKSAFRKLAKTYHPDANPGDAQAGARFNEANQAYEILGDKDKRAQFDRGEIDADGKPRFQGFPGGNPFGGGGGGRDPFGGAGGFEFRSGGDGGGGESMFADFFEQAFGGRTAGGSGNTGSRRSSGFTAARNASQKGEDLKANLKVRLEDVVSDEKVEAVFPSGKRLAIKLPAGVEDGQTIRLRGQGQPAPVAGGTAGDALVTIEFVEHPRFTARGRDLLLDLAVPLDVAVLGGPLPVETLDGRVSLRLPPWSNSGKTLRLKGKGLTTKAGGRGDILVSLRITLPAEPDPALAEFLKARQPATAD